MKQKEKELFMALCNMNSEVLDDNIIDSASPEVLGHLFFNRMQGIAYYVLKNCNCLSMVNREFRNSLRGAYEQSIVKNNNYFQCIAYVTEILSVCQCRYAMLKGAYLCDIYPEGCRTSNDIDLLVAPEDVSEIGEELLKFGFNQGYIKNDVFIPATRKEIIESKMMRGETVPYIKQIDLPGMKYLEVDINFSLDYKNGNTEVLHEMLKNITKKSCKEFDIWTLDNEDFFIHLCAHLYKEATTLPWIQMHRDMTLYKYCDIFLLLSCMSPKGIKNMFKRAKQFGMDKICAFAILQTMELFKYTDKTAKKESKASLQEDLDFMNRVISPAEKSVMKYKTKNVLRRFFMDNRLVDLEEVNI